MKSRIKKKSDKEKYVCHLDSIETKSTDLEIKFDNHKYLKKQINQAISQCRLERPPFEKNTEEEIHRKQIKKTK